MIYPEQFDERGIICQMNQAFMISKTKGNEITEEILKDIKIVKTLMFFLYTNSERRQHQGKYDTSALMMYRILELIMQRRITVYGINPDEPNYENLDYENVLKKFNEIKERNKMKGDNRLPSEITLLCRYILLNVLNDPVSPKLGKVRSTIGERNKSILVHGFRPIDESNLEKIEELAKELIEQFCKAENIDFENEIDYFRFISLPENENLYGLYR